ncbi:lipopolysaccharide export system protein LptC [Oxalobacteraceae bacterium GrIS 1.11]
MRKRIAHRWRLSVMILVGVLFALGSFWLLQVMNQSGLNAETGRHDNEPDYFVDQFSLVRMTPLGQPAYIVSGVKLTHRPLDDSSDIERPFVRKLSPAMPPMDVHADRGHIDQGNSRVQLMENVSLERDASPAAQHLHLSTQALTIFPDADRMESDQAVGVLLGNTSMTGIGMRANNATSQIDIGQRVRITIPPAPR